MAGTKTKVKMNSEYTIEELRAIKRATMQVHQILSNPTDQSPELLNYTLRQMSVDTVAYRGVAEPVVMSRFASLETLLLLSNALADDATWFFDKVLRHPNVRGDDGMAREYPQEAGYEGFGRRAALKRLLTHIIENASDDAIVRRAFEMFTDPQMSTQLATDSNHAQEWKRILFAGKPVDWNGFYTFIVRYIYDDSTKVRAAAAANRTLIGSQYDEVLANDAEFEVRLSLWKRGELSPALYDMMSEEFA